jgi:hypothetical protein
MIKCLDMDRKVCSHLGIEMDRWVAWQKTDEAGLCLICNLSSWLKLLRC